MKSIKSIRSFLLARFYRFAYSSPTIAPLLFPSWGLHGVFPDRFVSLCLEGFPRSGNTFAVSIINNQFPDLQVAHHTHTIASLKLATRHSVPCFVLIRAPIDAIASNALRGGATIDTSKEEQIHHDLLSYCNFYRFVESNIKKFQLITFDSLTQRPDVLLSTIANRLYLEFAMNEVDKTMPRAVKAIRDQELKRNEPAIGSTLPIEEKTPKLEELRSFIHAPDFAIKLSECERLYERLTANL